MKKESKDIFFVEVSNPDEVRRNVLESLREIVENLQRFERFKDSRKEKITQINSLGKTLKEINKLVSNLKNSLPETKLRAIKTTVKKPEKKKHLIRKKGKVKEAEEIKPEKKPLSELEKLESELSAIEEKLGSLK